MSDRTKAGVSRTERGVEKYRMARCDKYSGLRRMLNTSAGILLLAFIGISCNSPETIAGPEAKPINVTVQIDFGGNPETAVRHLEWKKEKLTALLALQSVAEVETHPEGSYIFVSSIDGVKGEKGKKVWYYTVNGAKSGKLAAWNELKDGDVVRWTYTQDICSKKVDKR